MTQFSLAKQAAGYAAADMIQENSYLGLGTGSTVYYFLEKLGQRCKEGLKIHAICSSKDTERRAKELGIPLADLPFISLDVVVDGADEIDDQKRLIKGGGGALLREKMLAYRAKKMIIIADEEKLSVSLGRSKLPVEIVPFAYQSTVMRIEDEGFSVKLRMDAEGKMYITDNGNYILDLSQYESKIEGLDARLHKIPGVVETGLFESYATQLVIGHADGNVKIFK